MAGTQEVWAFTVTIPAGTPVATPQITPITMPVRTVLSIRVRVPPGPSGTMGFAIGSTGHNVIPTNAGGWIITDDEVLNWALADLIDSGSWQLIGYNTDIFDHTVYLTFTVQVPDLPNNGVPVITAPSALSNTGTTTDTSTDLLVLPTAPELT